MKSIFQIIKITKKFWPYYLATSILIIIISLLNLANPVINKKIVEIIENNLKTGTGNLNLLITFLVLIIITDILITFFTNISGYLGDRLGAKLNTFLTAKFYKHILRLESEYFDNEPSGKIMNQLQRGIQNISDFINQMLNNFLPFFLTAIFTIIFISFYSWELAILLTLLFPIYIFISEKSSKSWIEKQSKINVIQDSVFARVLESINSIRVVKSFTTERIELNSFRKKREEIDKITKSQSREWHKFDVYRRLVLNIILFGIYAYVIYHTYQGRYSLAEMILLIQLVNQAKFPLYAMSFILGQIQRAQAGSKDFFDVLAKERKIKDHHDAKELDDVKGSVKFKDIIFNYEDNKKILDGISFSLRPGEKLAIVGESGGGKSTIANLLLRFYEPQSGEILIDNENINLVSQKSLHQNIAVVLQDSLLFSGSFKENILYGKPNASDEEVIEAAKAANCHDFIMGFKSGYDTQIGEKGVKLSGGQKQRLSIARAILKDSKILILDEATSSLDSKAEQEVQKALNELMSGRTTIIIAHRLATIKNVNKIIVLKDGKIIESGSPKELEKSDGVYAELLKLQSLSQTKKSHSKHLKKFDIIG